MDNFYKTDNVELFKIWVYNRLKEYTQLKIKIIDDNTYEIINDNKIGRFVVWPKEIIEESIEMDGEMIFYLHYEFHNFVYAVDLFERMIEVLLKENKVVRKKILLCCSGGMTTGYFASRANQFCRLNQLPYEIDANSVDKIFNIYKEYQMILLAPQIHYRLREIKECYPDSKVVLIDPSTFASYDCAKLIKVVEENLQ